MADNDDVPGTTGDGTAPADPSDSAAEHTRPVLPPDPAAATTPTAATASEPVLKTRWRDRAWSFRAMLAVALATLLLGGVAGGTIVALTDDDSDHGHFRMGPGGHFEKVPPGWRGPREFRDGGPDRQWNEGPPPPDGGATPYGQPTPPTPSPSQ